MKNRIRKLEVREGINPFKLVNNSGKELARIHVLFNEKTVRIIPISMKVQNLEVG